MKSFFIHFMRTCPRRLCEYCVLQIHSLFWFLWQLEGAFDPSTISLFLHFDDFIMNLCLIHAEVMQ